MSKYEALSQFLKSQGTQKVPMSFQKVEHVLGTTLPPSAYKHRPWWANEAAGHVHAKAWLAAGYETERVDMEGRKLVFRKVASGGMADAPREFQRDEQQSLQPRRSPLFGALKGTFTIEPGYDLTRPMFDDNEWAEIEANLERTADMIEQGMSKPR